MFRRLLSLVALLALAAPAAADQVMLTNGDRITGTVVSLAGNTLAVTTPHGGLRIPWATVAGLVIDDPILVTVGTAAPVEVRVAAGDAAGRVVLNPGGPVELAQIAALSRPMPAVTVTAAPTPGWCRAAATPTSTACASTRTSPCASWRTATRRPPP